MRRAPTLAVVTSTLAGLAASVNGQELNGNFHSDSLELRNGGADCNHNGFLDAVDVSRPHFAQALEHLNGVQQFQNNVWGVTPLDFNRDGRMDLALCAFTSTTSGTWRTWTTGAAPGPGMGRHDR